MSTSNQQDILDFLQRWIDAERKADHGTLDELLTDDFVGVGPRGVTLTKDQWLERYRTGALKHTTFDLEELQVRDYGTAAGVVAVQAQQSSYQEHDAGGRFRVGLMIVRPDGRWLLAGAQLSPLLGPPAPPN
jgi:ketosteroid isomerase-like protein